MTRTTHVVVLSDLGIVIINVYYNCVLCAFLLRIVAPPIESVCAFLLLRIVAPPIELV